MTTQCQIQRVGRSRAELDDIQARFRQNAAKFQPMPGISRSSSAPFTTFASRSSTNDTQLIATVTYDGDFKPYLADVFTNATL